MSHHMKHEETCTPDMGIFGAILAIGLALFVRYLRPLPLFLQTRKQTSSYKGKA